MVTVWLQYIRAYNRANTTLHYSTVQYAPLQAVPQQLSQRYQGVRLGRPALHSRVVAADGPDDAQQQQDRPAIAVGLTTTTATQCTYRYCGKAVIRVFYERGLSRVTSKSNMSIVWKDITQLLNGEYKYTSAPLYCTVVRVVQCSVVQCRVVQCRVV